MVRWQYNTEHKHDDAERKRKDILRYDMGRKGKGISDINVGYIPQVGRVRTGNDHLNIVVIEGQVDEIPAVTGWIRQWIIVVHRVLIDEPAADIKLYILVDRIKGKHVAYRWIDRDRPGYDRLFRVESCLVVCPVRDCVGGLLLPGVGCPIIRKDSDQKYENGNASQKIQYIIFVLGDFTHW